MKLKKVPKGQFQRGVKINLFALVANGFFSGNFSSNEWL